MNKNKDKKGEHKIIVGIPVVLEKANVVFNMDHLAFAGDEPVGINYMLLLTNRFRELNTKEHIIGVFHSDAAHITWSMMLTMLIAKLLPATLTKDSLLNC
jgi:hypothetical protein